MSRARTLFAGVIKGQAISLLADVIKTVEQDPLVRRRQTRRKIKAAAEQQNIKPKNRRAKTYREKIQIAAFWRISALKQVFRYGSKTAKLIACLCRLPSPIVFTKLPYTGDQTNLPIVVFGIADERKLLKGSFGIFHQQSA
jgi:hypothetical protein